MKITTAMVFQLLILASAYGRGTVIIHKQGDMGCHTFRIPGIAISNKGTLLAVFDMRYEKRKDLQANIDIGLSRSEDGGKTWSTPTPIMDMGEFGGLGQDQNGCSDPNILVNRRTGEIIVSAVWTHGKPGTHQWVGNGSEPGWDIGKSSQFMMVRSNDDGLTWSEPENWTSQLKDPSWYLFAPAPGNGITTSKGILVIPAEGRDATGEKFSTIMFSQDDGRTWEVGAFARKNTNECAVVELTDGSLMLNMRDFRNLDDKSETNGRAISITKDLGKNWMKHPTDHGALPEPGCMASLISHVLPNGRKILLFSNPDSKFNRERMTIKVSLDDGLTWPEDLQVLLDEEGGAYSCLVMVDENTVGILYESSVADIIFQRIPLTEFGIY